MLFTIVWIMIIAAFVIGRIKKKQKPQYVQEWDEKVKENQKAVIRLRNIAMPDTWFDSEKEWKENIQKELTTPLK